MSSAYGLTAAGFYPKSQQQIIAEMSAKLTALLGANVNLGAESVLGQLVGIFSEREALLWELAQAVYASQYPAGAEGVSVDNILALNNLTRLPARPTVTDPTPTTQSDGITLFGLVLYGTPGTVVPQGSIVKSTTTPPLSFTLDAEVTIQPAVNAAQNLVYSNTPSQGSFRLALTNPDTGSVLTTPLLAFNTVGQNTLLSFAAAPASGDFRLMVGRFSTAPLPYNVTSAQLQAAVRSLDATYSAATVSGSTAAGFSINFGAGMAYPASVNNTIVSFLATPTFGTWQLSINDTLTTTMAGPGISATILQEAVRAAGFPRALVADVSAGGAPKFVIHWVGSSSVPTVVVSISATSTTINVGSTQTLNQSATVANSLEATLSNLEDPATGKRPFSDVKVTGSAPVYTITYGARAPDTGMPTSGSKPQPILSVASNTLQQGGAVTNLSATIVTLGAPAEGIGTATCTVDGPNEVVASQLSVIGTPISGWTGVTNQLDCLTGSNVESDAEALARRTELLGAQANGPLQSIVSKVAQLPGVQAAVGFQNTTNAAVQILTFSSVPAGGTYRLMMQGGTTAAIAGNASANGVQQAINAVTGYNAAQVSGSTAFGLSIDWSGAFGGQAQTLVSVIDNTTGVTITPSFGRSPKSFEIVVEGGSSRAIAEAIYNTQPAGIASYGTPAAVTTGNVTAASTAVTVASSAGILAGQSVFGLGIANATTVASVVGTTVNLSQPAISTNAGTPLTFGNSTQILDAFGNPVLINFSRPVSILMYVSITLVTDQYRTPGVPSSGVNPQARFNPGSIPTIQEDIANIGNATPLGGLVVGFGSGGLIGAFNEVPGILGYTLHFGTSPNPSSNTNIQLLPTQAALFERFNVAVVYT